jgi:hypothetical protein
MKKIMSGAVIAVTCFVFGLTNAYATVVTIGGASSVGSDNPNQLWQGYMQVFELNANGGANYDAFQFGGSHLLGNVKTTVLSPTSLLLQPNFNLTSDTYYDNDGVFHDNNTDPYWVNSNGLGNKWTVSQSFTSPNGGLRAVNTDGLLTFTANYGNTLAAGYTVRPWITIFGGGAEGWVAYDWNTKIFGDALAAGDGSFSISTAGQDFANWGGNPLFQIGFEMQGVAARPSQEATLGGVTITAVPEPSVASLLGFGVAGLIATRFRRRS